MLRTFQGADFFSSTEVLRPAYLWNRYKSSPRIDFRALSRYSCKTASESISTSSATFILQEATNRDQALSFFQNERILQDARGVERLRMREGAFGKLPACPVRPTYGSTIFIITEIFKYMLWVIAYYWDTSRD